MIVGVGVVAEGTGVMTDAEGVGIGAGVGVEIRVGEGACGLLLTEDDDDEEEEVVVVDLLAALLMPDLMTVVVEDVVIDPFTHSPFSSISPSLLEQVLQATPPSLNVKAYEAGSHPPTQFPPLAINPLPQLAQTLLGSTPTATYTKENSSTTLEAEIVKTKLLSMEELKASGFEPVRESRFTP